MKCLAYMFPYCFICFFIIFLIFPCSLTAHHKACVALTFGNCPGCFRRLSRPKFLGHLLEQGSKQRKPTKNKEKQVLVGFS